VVVEIAVVIAIIPIVLRTPAMLVFVPPSMADAPAVLPRFVEFMTPAFGFPTPAAMMLNGFVQLVVGARNAALAIVAIGAQKRCSGEHQKASQRGCSKDRSSESQILQMILHRFASSLTILRFVHLCNLTSDLCNLSVVPMSSI
jgi:hypothetical protein